MSFFGASMARPDLINRSFARTRTLAARLRTTSRDSGCLTADVRGPGPARRIGLGPSNLCGAPAELLIESSRTCRKGGWQV